MKDANDTRNIAPRIGSPLWIFMTAVSVAGSGLLGIALFNLAHLDRWRILLSSPMFWVVGGMILAGEIWKIDIPGRSPAEAAGASRAITVGVMLFWGFPVAVLLRAVAVIVGGFAQRHTPHRVAFNAAQLSLSLGAAELVLLAFGASPTQGHPWLPKTSDPYVLIPMAIAYFVVNFGVVHVAIRLRTRSSFKSVIRANLRYQAGVSAIMFATAPLITVVMESGSTVIVALFAVPLATIYVSAAMLVTREQIG